MLEYPRLRACVNVDYSLTKRGLEVENDGK